MGEILEARRSEAQGRFERLVEQLRETEHRANDKACVYATGSFGRGEASMLSDLDLFIVGRGEKDRPALRPLDEICVKADLIEVSRRLRFPEFSGDGQYLAHYTEQELIGTLGKPDDDASNTFTARLLLLLESQPVLGKDIHDEAIGEVVAAYWKDYEDHKIDFIPTFLTNEILRLWRTFCVNYEARTAADPPERKAKRKLKITN